MSTVTPETSRNTALRDAFAGLIFVAAGSILYLQTADFPPTARTYPRIVLGAIILLSAIQTVRGVLRYWVDYLEGGRGEGLRFLLPRLGRGAPFALAATGYIFAITTVGYLVSTVVFLVGAVGARAGWRPAVIVPSAALAVTLYLVLENLLNISVPSGWLI